MIIEKLEAIDSLDHRNEELTDAVNKLQEREVNLQKSLQEKTAELEMTESRLNCLRQIRQNLEEDIALVRENGIEAIQEMASECTATMKAEVEEAYALNKDLVQRLSEMLERMDEKDKEDRRYIESMRAVRQIEPFVKRIARRGERVSEADYIGSCILILKLIIGSLPPDVQKKANTLNLMMELHRYHWSLGPATV